MPPQHESADLPSGVALPLLSLHPSDLQRHARAKRARPFVPWTRLSNAPLKNGDVPSPAWRDFYIIPNWRDAPFRVLIDPEGHLERSSACTHLAAAVLVAAWAVARPWVIPQDTLTAQLAGVAIVLVVVTFLVSTMFHVYSPVPGPAALVRTMDHSAIYLLMAASSCADLALAMRGLGDAPWQSVVDPVLAASVLIAYFATRRALVTAEETREAMYDTPCSLDFFRFQHSDLEHSALRVAGAAALTLAWVLLVAAAVANLETDVLVVWATGTFLGTVLLVSGQLVDNLYVVEDAYLRNQDKCFGACVRCHRPGWAFIMHSHAWWHVLAFLACAVLIAARDYGVLQQQRAR